MFRADGFILIATALVGSVWAVYASLGETRFFPASLRTTLGECPEHADYPAHRRPILEPDEASWLRHQLLALHEAPLAWGGAEQPRTVRFTVSAEPMLAAVRVTEAEGGRLHLTGKWLHPCADKRGCVVEKRLSAAEQARLEAALAPLLHVPSYGCYGGVDGSTLTLEASDGDTYRMWSQWSPRSGDLRAAGAVFLQLADYPLADEFSGSAAHP
jgi:hypothetical protein